jgi:hypothetical protein
MDDRKLLSVEETTEIRRMIKQTDKELVRQKAFTETETYKHLSYIKQIPHKFRIGYLEHEKEQMLKQINYIM